MSKKAPSLDVMLAAHDEAALAALASKGLLRRAQRDFEAGKAQLIDRTETEARLTVDGEELTLTGAGPGASSCSCAASGLCRHLLTAVLALRVEGGEGRGAERAAPSPREEILALTEDELEKFAGSDWGAAVALARLGGASAAQGVGLAVTLEGDDFPITFIGGTGLKGAVFKGAQSRARRSIAAAALILRFEAGKELPADVLSSFGLDQSYLDDLAGAIERAAASVLSGAADLARDLLFDLAISARVEAAPRIFSILRSLSQQAALAEERDVSFQPDDFLRDCARAYALAIALKSAPEDPTLTGTLRRDYARAEPLELHVLGALTWRTRAGARGLRVYGYDPEAGRWLRTGPARAAGADASFHPEHAYHTGLWGACAIADAVGQTLFLPGPRISNDGQISETADVNARVTQTAPSFDEWALEGAPHRDWATARAELAARFGDGLRRGAAPEPILLAPSGFGAVAFDEVAQAFSIPVMDQSGAAMRLTLEPDSESTPRRLLSLASRLKAVLVEAVLDGGRLRLKPVSALFNADGRLAIWNLDYGDAPGGAVKGGAARRRNTDRVSHAAVAAPQQDMIGRLAAQALEIAVSVTRGEQPLEVERCVVHAENVGLNTLAQALAVVAEEPSGPAALRLAYVAGEIQAMALTLQG